MKTWLKVGKTNNPKGWGRLKNKAFRPSGVKNHAG